MVNKPNNEELRAMMDAEARISEAESDADFDDGAPLPDHVKVSRPNRGKVLQVRLNQDEFDALERLAKDRGLPPSTVARSHLLKLLSGNGDQDPLGTMANAVELLHSMLLQFQSTPGFAASFAEIAKTKART